MDHCPPGSSVHGISQAKILEWVAIPFSRVSSWAGDQARISFTGRQILYHWSTWEAQFAKCIERLGISVLFIFFLFCRIRKYLYNLQVNRVSCILFFFFFLMSSLSISLRETFQEMDCWKALGDLCSEGLVNPDAVLLWWDAHWRSLYFDSLFTWSIWLPVETNLCSHNLVIIWFWSLVDICGVSQWWAHSHGRELNILSWKLRISPYGGICPWMDCCCFFFFLAKMIFPISCLV